jgi:polysaccharide export outer membrane protein
MTRVLRCSGLLAVAVAVTGALAPAAGADSRRPAPARTPAATAPAPTPAVAPARTAAPAPGAPAPAPPAAATPATPATVVAPAAVGSDYIIGPEDTLLVSVWKNEALSRQAPVRPDGKISLPLLHDVTAAGLTPMQLRDKIATALAEFLPNPEVSVTVLEVHSFRVSVLGEVQRPGVMAFKSNTTILEALAMAGGFSTFASPSKIVVFRKDARGQTQRIPFNYRRAITDAAGEVLTLRPGDVIVVP